MDEYLEEYKSLCDKLVEIYKQTHLFSERLCENGRLEKSFILRRDYEGERTCLENRQILRAEIQKLHSKKDEILRQIQEY